MFKFEIVDAQREACGEWIEQRRWGLFRYGPSGIHTVFTIPLTVWRAPHDEMFGPRTIRQ